MSFILEALKKADAERDRGAVPDLHAQGLLPEAAFEAEPAGRARPWLWLAAGVVLALFAGGVWQWMAADSAPPAAPVAAAPVAAAPAPAVAPPIPAPAAVAPAAPASIAAPVAAAPAAPKTDSARPAPKGTHEPASARREAKAPPPTPAETAGKADASHRGGLVATAPAARRNEAAQPPAEQPAAAATTSAARSGATASPSPPSKGSPTPPTIPAEHIPQLAELPDDVRRQVPALKLGGLVYSAAPASRMVLVNGDLQREGSAIAPGLTLERINPKSVVFSLRGQRFEVRL